MLNADGYRFGLLPLFCVGLRYSNHAAETLQSQLARIKSCTIQLHNTAPLVSPLSSVLKRLLLPLHAFPSQNVISLIMRCQNNHVKRLVANTLNKMLAPESNRIIIPLSYAMTYNDHVKTQNGM